MTNQNPGDRDENQPEVRSAEEDKKRRRIVARRILEASMLLPIVQPDDEDLQKWGRTNVSTSVAEIEGMIVSGMKQEALDHEQAVLQCIQIAERWPEWHRIRPGETRLHRAVRRITATANALCKMLPTDSRELQAALDRGMGRGLCEAEWKAIKDTFACLPVLAPGYDGTDDTSSAPSVCPRVDVQVYEPISNMVPASGSFAVWNADGKLVEEPVLGWVLMKVTTHHPDGTIERDPNEVHGVVAVEYGLDTPQVAENFYLYRTPGVTLEELQAELIRDAADQGQVSVDG